MIDTAMILAAGRGERMRPLTDHKPKPLLEVQGQALIDYHLYSLARIGVKRVVINHAWLGSQIEQHLGDGRQYGLQLLFSAEDPALETAGGIVKAMPMLTKNQQQAFIVVNGDIFTDFSFDRLPTELGKNLAHLVMVDNPPHHKNGDFSLHNGQLCLAGNSKKTFSGIAIYHRDFFHNVAALKQPLRPLFERYITANQISGQYYPGQWTDVGTPARLAALNQAKKQQKEYL